MVNLSKLKNNQRLPLVVVDRAGRAGYGVQPEVWDKGLPALVFNTLTRRNEMGRSNGSRSRLCPICGKRYTHTNFMTRRGVRDTDGKLLDDTHRIGCAKKRDKAIKPTTTKDQTPCQ